MNVEYFNSISTLDPGDYNTTIRLNENPDLPYVDSGLNGVIIDGYYLGDRSRYGVAFYDIGEEVFLRERLNIRPVDFTKRIEGFLFRNAETDFLINLQKVRIKPDNREENDDYILNTFIYDPSTVNYIKLFLDILEKR